MECSSKCFLPIIQGIINLQKQNQRLYPQKSENNNQIIEYIQNSPSFWMPIEQVFESKVPMGKLIYIGSDNPQHLNLQNIIKPAGTILSQEYMESIPNNGIVVIDQYFGDQNFLNYVGGLNYFISFLKSTGSIIYIHKIFNIEDPKRGIKQWETLNELKQLLKKTPKITKRSKKWIPNEEDIKYWKGIELNKAFIEKQDFELFKDNKKIPEIEYELKDGLLHLNLQPYPIQALPPISVLTLTKDRRREFPIAVYSILNQNYPKQNIEWVIVNNGNEQIKDLIPDNIGIRVKMVDIEPNQMTLAQLRNFSVEQASHNIVVHMDDDDFYPENSFAQRVTAILNGYDCVGCGITIAYNLLRNTCLPIGSEYGIAEATFAYTKRFWQRQKYPEQLICQEGDGFIWERKDQIRRLPFTEIIVVFNHPKNFTGSTRQSNEMKYEDYPLLEQLKEKDKQFIKQIQLKIAKEHIASGKGKILSFEQRQKLLKKNHKRH